MKTTYEELKANAATQARMTIDDQFTIAARTFRREAPEALVWSSEDGWRFWLGEEIQAGVWTMGADRGQGESVFAFGVFDSPEATITELERKVGA